MKRRRKEAEPGRDNLDRCEEHWTTGLWEGTMCQKQGCGPVQGVWSPSPSPLSSSAPPEKLTSPEASLLCRSCIMSFRHMMSLINRRSRCPDGREWGQRPGVWGKKELGPGTASNFPSTPVTRSQLLDKRSLSPPHRPCPMEFLGRTAALGSQFSMKP